MYLTFRGYCLGFATVLVLGCSSRSTTTTYPDAQDFDSGIPDATTGLDGGLDALKPPPVSGGGSVLLYGGRAQLLAEGSPCTHEVGVTNDRWCAFTTPSTNRIGSFDLFVINVSRAAAGVGIMCGGAVVDLNCLRLTGGFYEDELRLAQFQGDTLVYFDESGTPYGWRPGMINGRVLASATTGAVHSCEAARKGNAVLCLRDLPVMPTDTLVQSDLLVGRLDGANDPPLARIDTVISFNEADGDQPHFQDGFPTPGGDLVAWSSRAAPTGPEILKVQLVDNGTPLRTVASDVTTWSASPDGSHWYWVSQLNAMTGAGVLQTAPVPDGAAPTTLLASVVDFVVAPNGGIAAVTSGGGLRGFADPVGAPTTVTPIDNGVAGIVSVSRLGHVAYAKHFDPILRLIDLYVRKLDGTGTPCALSAQENSPIFAPFLPGAGAIIWARFTNLDLPIGDPIPTDGLLTRLSDCRTMPIASNIRNLATAGDESVLFANEGDLVDATLRVRNVAGGNMLGSDTPTLIQTRVDSFVSIFPSPGAVVFTVNADSAADGLYLRLIAASRTDADAGTGDAAITSDAATE